MPAAAVVAASVSVVSSLIVVLRATWPSGSNFSSVRGRVSQLKSTDTRTTAWPGPSTLFEHAFGFLGQVLLEIAPGGELVVGHPGHRIVLLVLRKGHCPGCPPPKHCWLAAPPRCWPRGNWMELTAEAGNCALPLTRTKTEAVGLRMTVGQQPVFRHDDHDAGRFDLVELADGAGQFALHGAGVIGPLHEIGNAEIGLVKYFETRRLRRAECPCRPFACAPDKPCPPGRRWNRRRALDRALWPRPARRSPWTLRLRPVCRKAANNRGGWTRNATPPRPHEDHDRGDDDADALIEAELFPDAGELAGELGKIFIHVSRCWAGAR